ncbi:hypothetical protein ACLOJK_040437 [Asimina triloba]
MLAVQVGYGIRLRLGFWGFWSGTHLAALMLGGTEMLLPLDRLFGMHLLESAQWLRMQSDGGRTAMAALLGSWLVVGHAIHHRCYLNVRLPSCCWLLAIIWILGRVLPRPLEMDLGCHCPGGSDWG